MRYLYLVLAIAGLAGVLATRRIRPDYVLVIHGGAGAISRAAMTPEKETAYRAGLQEALDAGRTILAAGGTAEDAVEASIRLLEDNPLFNAGRGAVLTHEGTAELDASFMSGRTGMAGAVAGVKTVRHPIAAARRVMENSEHVMLTGAGAEAFSAAQGLEIVSNRFFITEDRTRQLREVQAAEKQQTTPDPRDPARHKRGTVGAVALDKHGNLAAGTSTGGMTNKRYGRVGDAPIIGAGTYADNATCAVSCTGHGEYFIRNVVAYDVAARMRYGHTSLTTAAEEIIHQKLPPLGGTGGLIAVDKEGHITMPFNTEGMYRAFVTSTGETRVAIYQD